MASVRIRLDREEELTPDFLDLFSKLIINNADFALADQLHEGTEVPYRAFHQLLAKSCQFKHGLKSPLGRSRTQFTFNFTSKSNCLVLLLDLSPYMLVYNHGTRSFPLANLEEITLHLLRKLVLRAASDPSSDYRVSVVLFSVFRKEVEPVLVGEIVNERNAELLCEFVSRSIRQSSLPLDRSLRKENMRDILQVMFNSQEISFVGIRAVAIISSFHEEETGPLQFFTPNWYTLSLINTGGNFGSYTIDNQELIGKLMAGSYFRNKFVFKAVFLQNWEMTELVNKREPQSHKTVQEMFRAILFQHEGQRMEDILELLLRFQITFRDNKKTKAISGGESVISTIKDNPNKAILKTYKVPADSFVYILRTRYIQGWQPVLLNFTSLVQNTKFKLRLQISPNNFLYYEASRNQADFIISIYHNLLESASKDMSGNEKAELAASTERMDRINSYNFGNLLGQAYRLRETKYSKNSILFANHEHDAVQQLLANSNQWGKYFKLKRICFRFTPELNALYLQEFVNEISFILGRKISHTTFVRQSQSEKKCDKIDDIDTSSRRVLMTKVNAYGSVIQLELAFLHFNYAEIQCTLQSIFTKVHNRRFKWGVVQRVPALLASYFRDPQSAIHQLFHRKWVLRTGSKHYRDLFRIYWQQILKKDNYEQVFPKGFHQEKHYYKLLEVRTGPVPSTAVQMVAFLRVRQPQERQNQLHFQLSMPPSLLQVMPYSKEGKAISIPDLIATLMNELKMVQQQIVRLIDTYQAIHCKLLRHAINSTPKLIAQSLQKENSELYDIRLQHFRSILGMNCRDIMNKYYKQCKQSIHSLAVPSKLLMPTQLEKVQGDIDLVVQGKNYSFFLCTPYKFVYLHKREGSLYYKLVTLYYEQFNVHQNKPSFLETIHQGLIANVREQTYIKDFRVFLQGNFKGGIAKIINNSQFTHKDQQRIQLQPLLVLAAPAATPDPKSIEYQRIRTAMETFSSKLFELIAQFFPRLRVNYYFQIRNDKQAKAPFNIQPAISRLDTQLFMRASFISADGSVVDITPTNLPDLIMKNYADVLKGRAQLEFCFYLKVKNSSEKNENSFTFVHYLIDRTQCLINDVSYQVERVSQTNREFSPDQMHFLSRDIRVQVVKLQLIKQEQDSVDALCRHVQAQAMQALIRFRRVRQSPPEFLVFKDEPPNAILIEKSMLMRIKTGSLIEFIYRPSDFYILEHQEGKEMLLKYFERLRNFINASRLVQQLSETFELPLEPYELWLNDSANHANNKIIIAKKKKVAKNPANKYLRKNIMASQTPTNNLNTVTSSKLVPLSLIYRNFLPLNERIPANQGLQALKEDQIFKLSEIHNLKNTYLFLNFTDKEHIIFHFQQRDDETALKELALENRIPIPRCKKYLLYYVFCANPLVKRQNIEKLFYQLLKQAINRKLFDEVSTYLLTHCDLIQDDEQFFIRGAGQRKDTKQFKFDLPQHFYRQQLMRYLQQHIEIYHYVTAFRSDSEQKTRQDPNFLESIRVIEPSNIENTKIYSDYMRELTAGKRVQSSQEPIENSLWASTNFQRNRYSDFRGSESSVSMLRSTEGFFEGQTSFKYEYVDGMWLFNSARPRLNLAERFGKCLYVLRVKIREQSNKQDDFECLVMGRSNFLYSSQHEESQLAEYKKYLLKRNSLKVLKRDSFMRSNIAFQITDHVGSLKIPETQQAFFFVTRATIAEYYLQNFFYVRYKYITSNIYLAQCQAPKGSLLGVPELQEFSSGSSRTLSAQERAVEAQRDAMMELFEWKGEVQAMLEQINSLLFFRYKSSTILVRDIFVYFNRFVLEFYGILTELHKGEDIGGLKALIYLEEADEKWSFWTMNLNQTDKLQQRLQLKGTEPTAKLGFILTDYLQEISIVLDNILHKKETPHGSSAKLQALKYLQNVRAGDKTKEYWFKRSLFVSFEISYEHFIYCSYNLQPEVDRQVKDWLAAIDCWLNQKNKLLRFIKNVKENSSYEINLKPNPQRKNHSFYELRYLQRPFVQRQDSQARPVISMYRLLVNLTFSDFPLARKEKEEKEQQKQQKEKKNRTRYLHHCVQVRQLLEILQSSPVNYGLFGSYKGTEKFILERLGREYISILREEYSMAN